MEHRARRFYGLFRLLLKLLRKVKDLTTESVFTLKQILNL